MGGTQHGGFKAAATNKQRYGLNFYPQIGRKGGKISRGGGFQAGAEATREAGRKGAVTSVASRQAQKAAREAAEREGAVHSEEPSPLSPYITRLKRIADNFSIIPNPHH